ncbi:MAG TPA: TIGR02266 family protein [Kofleriaceae bacterium]
MSHSGENALVDPNTRQGKRTPVTLKIKFKSETLEQFIERYAVDVSQGGIFIRTKEPLAVGTQMRFEFQLRDASPLIAGEGTVVWTRENDPSRPAIAPGMGVRFDRLAEGSQQVLERILADKAKQAPSRSGAESTKPPMFTDTPTRVAPAPVQEALLGDKAPGKSANTTARKSDFKEEGTPLPRPMPFHGDQDDFDEGAFDEATKVRALDELIAQTAPDTSTDLMGGRDMSNETVIGPDISAATAKADAAQAKAQEPASRDSAPALPTPPEPSRPSSRVLDATPSPRAEPVASGSGSGLAASTEHPPEMRTRLGMEPAKVVTKPPVNVPAEPPPAAKEKTEEKAAAKAVAKSTPSEAPRRPEKQGGGMGAAIMIILAIALIGGAVWFFVLRKNEKPKSGEGDVASGAGPASGSNSVVAPQPDAAEVGSGSTQVADVGSAKTNDVGSGSAKTNDVGSGSNATPTATSTLVDTTINTDPPKAMVEIEGQSGPGPFKAKLEKDKTYKAKVTAPGYAAAEIDVKGGAPSIVAKLTMKPHIVSVASEPVGAAIFIDNSATGKVTPFDIELTKAQAARKMIRVSIRKAGFKTIERVVDSTKWTEDAARMTASVSETMSVQQVVQVPRPPPTGTGSGSAETGSASTPTPPPTGDGSGSAAPPTEKPPTEKLPTEKPPEDKPPESQNFLQ